ncbi:hypothetical protein Ctha_1611 [Chloroherpeton thalassium ATCC 35110]|uniref:DUF1232 domain-containing protein n=1 Tax=Chloroherpeton thalassium (strain ATCC 35110 / GB-78) TaxID=517418 RepID=B3QSM2_CHLT3|nr:hypothetical protein Ctha_1611 [Chloroherpeton thalassium ATCC 35110]
MLFETIKLIWRAATKSERVLLVVCILYILWPLDLFPEAVFGFFGLIDDAAALATLVAVIKRIRSRISPEE